MRRQQTPFIPLSPRGKDTPLRDYTSKRRFEATPEPKAGRRPPGEGRLVFVVHKHAARALHYDLRLELEGVLKSWAVPKGPSMDPAVKRLAVMVEDHPFEYRDFEGVIPEGNYGAGSVIIWDRGFYQHPGPAAAQGAGGEKALLDGLHKGDLKFVLQGEKLRGEFALVKTGRDEKSWLLIKKKDRYATRNEVLEENRSVASGKTLEKIAAAAGGRSAAPEKRHRLRLREALESTAFKDAPSAPVPRGMRPMLATLAAKPFDHPDWVFEVKWDGYRAVAELGARRVSLHSRNLIRFGDRFSRIADSLRTFGFEAVLDGEIVVLDEGGRPDFQALQQYGGAGNGPLIYYVFDLPYFEGRDLRGVPLVARKELLGKILPPDTAVRFSDHVRKEGKLFFEEARKKGLEGIMAKHSRSLYEDGLRSRQWLKIKTRRTQEAVIAGFTEPGGGRRHFGALVLGAFAGSELVYVGHVGGGFDAGSLGEIREKLGPLIRKRSPFRTTPATNTPVTWVKPDLVCEVAFAGWTGEGVMRQPVFLRLREDKTPGEAVRESPARAPGPWKEER